MTQDKGQFEQTATALNSGAIHLLRALGSTDRASGVPPAQLSALSVLVFAGPRSLGALAQAEDVAGPTMTRIVDGLVASGLARRLPHPGDRRAVEVSATRRGVSVMRRARERRVSVLVTAMRHLDGGDQRLLADAAPLLDDLAVALRRSPIPAASRRRY